MLRIKKTSKKIKKDKGITLIALMVTIIVLLILAGVSIATLLGDDGVLARAQDAKLQTRIGKVKEEVQRWKTSKELYKQSRIRKCTNRRGVY